MRIEFELSVNSRLGGSSTGKLLARQELDFMKSSCLSSDHPRRLLVFGQAALFRRLRSPCVALGRVDQGVRGGDHRWVGIFEGAL